MSDLERLQEPDEGFIEAQNKISQMIEMMNMGQVQLPRHVFAMVRDKKRIRYGFDIEFNYDQNGTLKSSNREIGILKKEITMAQIFDRILNKLPDTAILCDESIAYSLGMKKMPQRQIVKIEFDTFGIVKFDIIRPQGVIKVYSASTSYRKQR